MLNLPSPAVFVGDNDRRVSQLRRELHPIGAPGSAGRPVRRWVGRELVRIGARLAADPSLKPAPSPS
jgi:hypothetical protein